MKYLFSPVSVKNKFIYKSAPDNQSGPEVYNEKVKDLTEEKNGLRDWNKDMTKGKLSKLSKEAWKTNPQNKLAKDIFKQQDKEVRFVQAGDTIASVVKGLTKAIKWDQAVVYRGKDGNEGRNITSKKLKNQFEKNKSGKLEGASLLYPGQYVWIEDGKIIVGEKAPVIIEPKKEDDTTQNTSVPDSVPDSGDKVEEIDTNEASRDVNLSKAAQMTAFYDEGESFFQEGRYNKAIKAYQKIIRVQGKQAPKALLRQGEAFEKLGDYETAKIIYKKLTRSFSGTNEAEEAQKKLEPAQVEVKTEVSSELPAEAENLTKLKNEYNTLRKKQRDSVNIFKNLEGGLKDLQDIEGYDQEILIEWNKSFSNKTEYEKYIPKLKKEISVLQEGIKLLEEKQAEKKEDKKAIPTIDEFRAQIEEIIKKIDTNGTNAFGIKDNLSGPIFRILGGTDDYGKTQKEFRKGKEEGIKESWIENAIIQAGREKDPKKYLDDLAKDFEKKLKDKEGDGFGWVLGDDFVSQKEAEALNEEMLSEVGAEKNIFKNKEELSLQAAHKTDLGNPEKFQMVKAHEGEIKPAQKLPETKIPHVSKGWEVNQTFAKPKDNTEEISFDNQDLAQRIKESLMTTANYTVNWDKNTFFIREGKIKINQKINNAWMDLVSNEADLSLEGDENIDEVLIYLNDNKAEIKGEFESLSTTEKKEIPVEVKIVETLQNKLEEIKIKGYDLSVEGKDVVINKSGEDNVFAKGEFLSSNKEDLEKRIRMVIKAVEDGVTQVEVNNPEEDLASLRAILKENNEIDGTTFSINKEGVLLATSKAYKHGGYILRQVKFPELYKVKSLSELKKAVKEITKVLEKNFEAEGIVDKKDVYSETSTLTEKPNYEDLNKPNTDFNGEDISNLDLSKLSDAKLEGAFVSHKQLSSKGFSVKYKTKTEKEETGLFEVVRRNPN